MDPLMKLSSGGSLLIHQEHQRHQEHFSLNINCMTAHVAINSHLPAPFNLQAIAALKAQHDSDLASQGKTHEENSNSIISDLRSQIVSLHTNLDGAQVYAAANAAHKALDLCRGEGGGEGERSAVHLEAERLREELEAVKGEVQVRSAVSCRAYVLGCKAWIRVCAELMRLLLLLLLLLLFVLGD